METIQRSPFTRKLYLLWKHFVIYTEPFATVIPVYTIQPVIQPDVKAVGQPVVSCIQTFNRLYNRLYEFNTSDSNPVYTTNRLSKRLYRVNGVLE